MIQSEIEKKVPQPFYSAKAVKKIKKSIYLFWIFSMPIVSLVIWPIFFVWTDHRNSSRAAMAITLICLTLIFIFMFLKHFFRITNSYSRTVRAVIIKSLIIAFFFLIFPIIELFLIFLPMKFYPHGSAFGNSASGIALIAGFILTIPFQVIVPYLVSIPFLVSSSSIAKIAGNKSEDLSLYSESKKALLKMYLYSGLTMGMLGIFAILIWKSAI